MGNLTFYFDYYIQIVRLDNCFESVKHLVLSVEHCCHIRASRVIPVTINSLRIFLSKKLDRTTLPRGFHKTIKYQGMEKHLSYIKLAARTLYSSRLNIIHPALQKPSKLFYNLHGKWYVASKQNKTQDSSNTFQVRHLSIY